VMLTDETHVSGITVGEPRTVLRRFRLVHSAITAAGRGGLLQGGVQLLLATGAVQVLSYLYHVVMSRVLGPADYGALVVLLSLLLILTVPTNTLQTTVALETAGCVPDRQGALAIALIGEMRRRWLVPALFSWLALALASPVLSGVLHLPGYGPVIAAGALLPLAAFLPVVRGLLQGAHSFGRLGLNLLVESGGKLVIGVALVGLGLGLLGAMGGVVLGGLAALAWGITQLPRKAVPQSGDSTTASPLLHAAAPVGATLLIFAVMTNADVILVKLFFPPHDAGYYAAANMAGKVLIYATWPVWAVLFPALGRDGGPSPLTRRRLWMGIGWTLIIGAPILLFYALDPRLAMIILFGRQYLAGSHLLLPLGLAMTFYQIAFLSMSHELAVGDVKYLWPALLSVVVLTGLLVSVPRTLEAFAYTMVIVAVAIALTVTSFTCASSGT